MGENQKPVPRFRHRGENVVKYKEDQNPQNPKQIHEWLKKSPESTLGDFVICEN